MKYVQPYGISDPDAPYINGRPDIAQQGSIPPAAAFEHPMRELVAVISNSLITPLDTDLEQAAKAIRSQRMNYAEDTGSVNLLSVAYDPPFGDYSIGLPLCVKVLNTNTGASTIEAGAGRVGIKKPSGAEVAAGDLPASGLIELVYDGTNFQMINFGGAGAGGGGSTFYINIPYTVDTSITANIITANFSPAVTAISPGTIVMVKAANTSTGPTTININGLGARPIKALGGLPAMPFLPGDIQAADVVILTYDGTSFWITPNSAISQNITLNVANNADIDTVFAALARKRVLPAVTLTIQLATGIYTPFHSYHIDADRIVVQGTMLAANPVMNSFARTGNRSLDGSNNLAMLRGRYGTEVRFNNTNHVYFAIWHEGPGCMTFTNILLVGPNVQHPGITNQALAQPIAGAGSDGGEVALRGVSVWGCGVTGIQAWQSGTVYAYNSFVSSCQYHGFIANLSGAVYMNGCGSFGGYYGGVGTNQMGSVYMQNSYSQDNDYGVGCQAGAVWIGSGCVVTLNFTLDAYAFGNAHVVANVPQGAVIGTMSPAYGTTGNNNSYMNPGS